MLTPAAYAQSALYTENSPGIGMYAFSLAPLLFITKLEPFAVLVTFSAVISALFIPMLIDFPPKLSYNLLPYSSSVLMTQQSHISKSFFFALK